MRPYLLVNPKGINLEWYIKNFAPKLSLEYLRFLLHFVIYGIASSIEKDYNNAKSDTHYVAISSKTILLKHKLRAHIRFLCETWLGKSNFLLRRDYKLGKCYSYTLSPFSKERGLEALELHNTSLSNKIRKSNTYIADEVSKKNGTYNYLLKYFNKEKLTIDINSALSLCEKRYTLHQNHNKYLKEFTQIVNLYNGSYRICHKPETDARIHTNLTSIPKVYRKYIKYQGKQLAEVDLSNSIIFFIAMCLSGRVSESILSNNSLLYMFTKYLSAVDKSEIELFYILSVSGSFYDSFIPEFVKAFTEEELSKHYSYYYDGNYNGSFKHKRNVAKRLLLSMLFDKNGGKRKIEKIFLGKFPSIFKAIKQFKKEKNYKKLSHLVFQLEAEIMLNVVGRAFNNKYYRKAPLFTLHDCLITTIDFIPELEVLMIDEFINQFGVAPKICQKTWN